MAFLTKIRPTKGFSVLRVVTAVLVLGLLVVFVAESAKYFYSFSVPKSVSSKVDPHLKQVAAVLGSAKSSVDSISKLGALESTGSSNVASERPVKLTVGVLADSHNGLAYLTRALTQLRSLGVDYILFLGDYTDWGDEAALKKAKSTMDVSSVPYFSLPGDHDLGQTRDESNFEAVFGQARGVLTEKSVTITYFDNSKNFTKIQESDMLWFKQAIVDSQFLFLSQPLVTNDMSRVMGIIDGVKDEAVHAQNLELLKAVRESGVKAVIAGDLHLFTSYQDPEKADLMHYSIGAVLKSQSVEKFNFQSPRFAVFKVFADDTFELVDTPIN
ncbi:hypothetical protein A2709_01370 [candidate division WWE3 bacterium RIFCSPHIGHO2_01_FULL_43_9]|uniref:Calcineurin-like phosphoesterase domain-containing protein n=1 Tax=candidate division WWE3 bacterium RIFCSPHIGHO2_01_FULL_43_9 TaxID=1802618 RepID=A0A1F4V294_UNCKA|nr:MAG: hypothetical protein A2709_01370 [candidate division WWE3 bacterium RIFCSPHIGHO2_01_FULL_43_9]